MKALPPIMAAVLALGLAACGSSSSSSSSSTSAASSSTSSAAAPPASGGAVKVTMKNIAFNPSALHAKVGQTVEWTNEDPVSHNVTYRGGPRFVSSPTMPQGAKFTIKLTQPGTIHYVCTFHANMIASIVVSK